MADQEPNAGGWGVDRFTKYVLHCEEMTRQAFESQQGLVQAAIAGDHLTTSVMVRAMRNCGVENAPTGALFMQMAAQYRNTLRMSMSGQFLAGHVLQRAMIECAVYGWVCARDPNRRRKWVERGRDERSRRSARRAFAWTPLLEELQANEHDLGPHVQIVYERLIDLGAHPNSAGVALGVEIDWAEDATRMWFSFGIDDERALQETLGHAMYVLEIGLWLVWRTFPDMSELVQFPAALRSWREQWWSAARHAGLYLEPLQQQ